MGRIGGIDHVALDVVDLERSTAFYTAIFGARVVLEHPPEPPIVVRQLLVGAALLSIHEMGGGLDPRLLAARPTPGAADFCLTWEGEIDEVCDLLRRHGVDTIAGPVPRRTHTGVPSRSVYFRDPDGNLVELMVADE